MTSKTTTLTQVREELEHFPDYPPRDDMQNWRYLYDTSVLTSLSIHYADQPNVTVASEVPVSPSLPMRDDVRIPDLLFVRDGDRELMEEQRGYAIDRQGKAPDFVLEVASPTTGRIDYTDKREDYERFGVGEYWRFDPSDSEYHNVALAGDRLVDGVYEAIEIEKLGEGRFGDTARLWGCTCAGRMGCCGSSTLLQRAISWLTTRSAPAVWRQRGALRRWKRSFGNATSRRFHSTAM